MAEILITGGAGNFGRTVAQPLQAAGHSLRLLDLPVCDFSFCNAWENTRAIPGDILDSSCMKAAVDGVDWVLHLAAILPPFSEEDKDRTFRVNVNGTRVLAEACGAVPTPPRSPLLHPFPYMATPAEKKNRSMPNIPSIPMTGMQKARWRRKKYWSIAAFPLPIFGFQAS